MSSNGARDPEISPDDRTITRNMKIIKLSQPHPRRTRRLPSSIRHGSAAVVVWLLFVVVILKALVCLLPVKSGYNDVGISTISFSGFGPNPAGFAQIRVGQGV